MSIVANLRTVGKRLLVAALLIVPVISAGWTGDSLLDLVRTQSEWPQQASWYGGWGGWLESLFTTPWTHDADVRLAGAVGGMVLFVVSVLGLYFFRRSLVSTYARLLPNVTPEGRSVLIIALSTKKKANEPADQARIDAGFAALKTLPIETSAQDVPTLKAMKGKGDPALDALVAEPPNWQQGFRIVWDHVRASKRRNPFRAVLVVTSPESESQVAEFCAVLKDRLLDAAPRHGIAPSALPLIEPVTPGGVRFDHHDGVILALNQAVDHARKQHKARHGRVCLDVTAGTKTFSIAAAMVTLNRKLIFSYIDNSGKPLYFDAGIEVGAALGES